MALPVKLQWSLNGIETHLAIVEDLMSDDSPIRDPEERYKQVMRALAQTRQHAEKARGLTEYFMSDAPYPAPAGDRNLMFQVKTRDGRTHLLLKKSQLRRFLETHTEADIINYAMRSDYRFEHASWEELTAYAYRKGE